MDDHHDSQSQSFSGSGSYDSSSESSRSFSYTGSGTYSGTASGSGSGSQSGSSDDDGNSNDQEAGEIPRRVEVPPLSGHHQTPPRTTKRERIPIPIFNRNETRDDDVRARERERERSPHRTRVGDTDVIAIVHLRRTSDGPSMPFIVDIVKREIAHAVSDVHFDIDSLLIESDTVMTVKLKDEKNKNDVFVLFQLVNDVVHGMFWVNVTVSCKLPRALVV